MTSWTAACQTPLSIGFLSQEYWSGLPFPSPRDLPDPGIKPRSPALAGGFFTTELPWEPRCGSELPTKTKTIKLLGKTWRRKSSRLQIRQNFLDKRVKVFAIRKNSLVRLHQNFKISILHKTLWKENISHRLERKWNFSVVTGSLPPRGLWPTTLLCPWDFPHKSTRVGCHFLLQRILLIHGSNPGLPHCRQMLYHLIYQGSPPRLEESTYNSHIWYRIYI